MSAPNRSTQQNRFRKIVPAIQRYLGQPQILLAGVTFTPASLVQFFQDHVNQPTVLAEFGVPPRKTPTTTVETKALAVQKNLATRAARHTMGKRS